MSIKYKFTGKTKNHLGCTLHQIVCVTAFASIEVGDVGGWIEKEENLSQYGNAWVSGDAEVSGDARVYGDAWVYGDARVYGNAEVCTKKAVTVSWTGYHVTITDTHITIGCQSHPIEFWKEVTVEQIAKMDGKKSADTWGKFKPFIMLLEQERNGK